MAGSWTGVGGHLGRRGQVGLKGLFMRCVTEVGNWLSNVLGEHVNQSGEREMSEHPALRGNEMYNKLPTSSEITDSTCGALLVKRMSAALC